MSDCRRLPTAWFVRFSGQSSGKVHCPALFIWTISCTAGVNVTKRYTVRICIPLPPIIATIQVPEKERDSTYIRLICVSFSTKIVWKNLDRITTETTGIHLICKNGHGPIVICKSEESFICYIPDSCFGRNMALPPVFNNTGMFWRIWWPIMK